MDYRGICIKRGKNVEVSKVLLKVATTYNDKNIYHTGRVFPRYVLIYVYAYLAPLFHKLYKFLHEPKIREVVNKVYCKKEHF